VPLTQAGSLKGIKNATTEELATMAGTCQELAQQIKT